MTPDELKNRTTISVRELAEVVGCGRRQSYELAATLPQIRVGRAIKIPTGPVLEMIGHPIAGQVGTAPESTP